MHIIFFTEEPSAEKVLHNIVPKLIKDNTFEIHKFQGKHNLLKKLPERLKGYRNWIPKDYKIVVLMDRDNDDCYELKGKMESIAEEAGFITKTKSLSPSSFQIVNRIAIEELEAWFFGDIPAMIKAFPKIPTNLSKKAKYRDPDAITNGTYESLKRLLNRKGYYKNIDYLPKIEVAEKISKFMNPNKNNSKSFQVFRDALKEMTGIPIRNMKKPA